MLTYTNYFLTIFDVVPSLFFVIHLQVGLACAQIAHFRGLRVLGTAGSQAGLDLIARNGCDAVFCHREEGYATKIMVPLQLSSIFCF